MDSLITSIILPRSSILLWRQCFRNITSVSYRLQSHFINFNSLIDLVQLAILSNTQGSFFRKYKGSGRKFSKSFEFDIFVEADEIPADLEDLLIGVIKVLMALGSRFTYRGRCFGGAPLSYGVRDTDPLQLIAHDILEFVLYQTELHHRVAGEYGAAEGEPGIVGASLPPAGLPLGLDLRTLAGAA